MNAFGFPTYSIVGTPSGGEEATVTINDNTPDAFGSYWVLSGDIGGWDSPDMRVTMLTKIGHDSSAEGEIPADLHYRGRSLTMTLYAECESEIARENSRLLLAQAANTDACVFTAFEDVPKNLNVVRSGNTNQGKITMAELGYPSKAASTSDPSLMPDGFGFPSGTTVYPMKVDIELYAQDPFKYAVTAITESFSGGGMAISNPGTYPSMNGVIDLSATGGGVGPIFLATPERSMTLAVPAVPAGAPALSDIPPGLAIDLYNKLIVYGFANYYFLRDMRTPWLRIPTGSTTLGVDPVQPGTLTFYPSWL